MYILAWASIRLNLFLQANRRDLTNGATKVAEEAKHQNKKWVLPVIWKFCELDVSQDRYSNGRQSCTAFFKGCFFAWYSVVGLGGGGEVRATPH